MFQKLASGCYRSQGRYRYRSKAHFYIAVHTCTSYYSALRFLLRSAKHIFPVIKSIPFMPPYAVATQIVSESGYSSTSQTSLSNKRWLGSADLLYTTKFLPSKRFNPSWVTIHIKPYLSWIIFFTL